MGITFLVGGGVMRSRVAAVHVKQDEKAKPHTVIELE